MTKTNLLCLLLIFIIVPLSAQVGIGTVTPDQSAILDLNSTTSGLLIPRVTQVQRDAIGTPGTGLLVFQTDNTSGFYYYDGAAWQPFTGTDNDWTVNGNDMYNANSGNVGIGTNNPTSKVHIEYVDPASSILNQDFETALTPMTTSGNANWFLQGTNVNTGAQAAQSGNIGDGEESIMEYVATLPAGGGSLSFYYQVSSEATFDSLEFSVDGIVIDQWSGTVGWTEYTYDFTTAGSYTLRWRYYKDVSNSVGDDAARLDDIIVSSNVGSAIRIVDGSQADGKVLTSDAQGNALWKTITTANIGDIPQIASVSGLEIPICVSSPVGAMGSFVVDVQGVSTTVNYEVLIQQTNTGSVVTVAGTDVMAAPLRPERLQVRYDFSPPLPFPPNGIIFSANNASSFPDTFSMNYALKSDTSITVNITRTDTFGDTSAVCWAGQFFFDMIITD